MCSKSTTVGKPVSTTVLVFQSTQLKWGNPTEVGLFGVCINVQSKHTYLRTHMLHGILCLQALVSAATAERSATVRRAEAAAVARLAPRCSETRTHKLAEQICEMARCGSAD